MTTLTAAAVAEAIDQLVIERGEDYVYPSEGGRCFYSFEDGSPGCLVGAVIAKLAPAAFARLVQFEAPFEATEGEVHRRRAGAVGGIISSHAEDWEVTRDFGLEADRVLRRALGAAQQAQDTGATWSEARRRFIWTIDLLEA